MRSVSLVTFLVITALASAGAAGAQAPGPEDVVPLACGVVGEADPDLRDEIPVCPREDPGPPAEPDENEDDEEVAEEEEAADANDDAPDPAEDPAGAAGTLQDEVQDGVEEVAEDPTRAPDVLVGFVATVRGMLEDLLQLPIVVGNAFMDAGAAVADGVKAVAGAAYDAMVDAAAAVTDAARAGASAVAGAYTAGSDAVQAGARSAADAARHVATLVHDLLPAPTPEDAGARAPDRVDDAARDATGVVDTVRSLVDA